MNTLAKQLLMAASMEAAIPASKTATFISSAFQDSTSVGITVPSNVSVGDLALYGELTGHSGNVLSDLAGWTLVQSTSVSISRVSLWYKFLTVSDISSTLRHPFSGTIFARLGMVVLRPASASTSVLVSDIQVDLRQNDLSASVTIPATSPVPVIKFVFNAALFGLQTLAINPSTGFNTQAGLNNSTFLAFKNQTTLDQTISATISNPSNSSTIVASGFNFRIS
jgi:hypothetical protein